MIPEVNEIIEKQEEMIIELKTENERLQKDIYVIQQQTDEWLKGKLGLEIKNRNIIEDVKNLIWTAINTYRNLRKGVRDKQVILSLFIHFGSISVCKLFGISASTFSAIGQIYREDPSLSQGMIPIYFETRKY